MVHDFGVRLIDSGLSLAGSFFAWLSDSGRKFCDRLFIFRFSLKIFLLGLMMIAKHDDIIFAIEFLELAFHLFVLLRLIKNDYKVNILS